MKKLIFALALLVMGGASLSTAASAASISPAAATISEAAQSDSALQLTGGGHHRRRYFRYGGYRHNSFYRKGYSGYPYGYYDGFCYDRPYHWWCKRYFFKNYE